MATLGNWLLKKDRRYPPISGATIGNQNICCNYVNHFKMMPKILFNKLDQHLLEES